MFPLPSASRILLRRSFQAQRALFTPFISEQRQHRSNMAEGFKENLAKGKMLRFEDSLPQLPVPSLEETMKRYLKSVHPLLSQSEYDRTKKAVEAFQAPGSFGHTLQERLIERSKDPNIKNWLAEWWNRIAYFGSRAPIIPYVSYFYSHRDDRKRRDPAKRAAAIATATIEFKRLTDTYELEPEYMKKQPLAMSSFEWMFNSCRIPAKPTDFAVKYSGDEHKHFLVIRKNNFFKVLHEHNGQSLNTTELEAQMNKVYQLAEKSPAVGIMTTENRDRWTDMRDRLMKSNAANKAALEMIESASFVICLDDATPVTLHERCIQYWHGDGANRWFDKPCQFIVNDNGTSGFNGEHSMLDGTPTHKLNEDIMDWIFNEKLDFDNPEIRSDIPDPQPIKFHLNGENMADIAIATTHHVGVISQQELKVEAYQGYGKEQIKKFKASPDAYVQMVIQLAYRKFYGKNRPTYESAATRFFQEGRTETCRTVSDESVAFCEAMSHPLSSNEECYELFSKAAKGHVEYITAATDGRGVDRHLFGLTEVIREGEETPDLFKDPAYTYSQTWYISSSQLSSEFYNGYGWSQVVDDGWGIAYMINNDNIQFNIVSKNLGCERMAFFINEAAGEMKHMMEAAIAAQQKDKAKL